MTLNIGNFTTENSVRCRALHAGTVFSLPSNQSKISHYGCNYKRWHVENDYHQSGWQKFKDWTFNHEVGAGYYRVTGDAGSHLLYLVEGGESEAVTGKARFLWP